ncbi:MAG TPA: lysophospholipid acyltransferase family protein [Myxococcota bacterium]|nr:lysophospholipid acyltransferase family protein [Myxococcota bacterium]
MARAARTASSRALALAGAVAALLLRALGATWRIEVLGEHPLRPGAPTVVGALWHEGLLAASYLFRDHDVVVMVSRSRDGDLIDAVLSRLGYARSARGSSSRGGVGALRAQIELVRGGRSGALLCDGPRGPAHVAKPGSVLLAQQAGRPLLAAAIGARPCWRFRSWDRSILPLPFARVVCAFGVPFEVPSEAGREGLAHAGRRLQAELEQLSAIVAERLRPPGSTACA